MLGGLGGRRVRTAAVAVAILGAATVSLVVAPSAGAATAVPRPDHTVVVILENHSSEAIMGNAAAPYINHLAATGADMTQSYGETHPSQPNYIALFSGSLNGVTDNTCPSTINAPNLGAQLITAGMSFIGYSEDLPSPGYTGCGSGNYARKHNPWVDFPSVPAAYNQPLTAFPSDYNNLPTVSIVVPNLQNDMHDGTISQADTWLHDHIDGYVTWAQQNNSILVLTWDEDDNAQNNHIPTIIVGGGVRPGSYSQRINHYNVLRTIQDAYGLAPIANSATAAPILDIWADGTGEPPVASFTAQCTNLSCQTNAGQSSDPDGTLTGYQWSWGDGSAASTGVSATHTYGAPGTYTVTLTVTDNSGQRGSTSRQVTATPPGSFTYASDSFARTVASGWGTAEVGGQWTVGGSTSSVSGGTGKQRLAAGAGAVAYLSSVSAADVDVTFDAALDKVATGGGTYVTAKARRNGSTDYDLKVRWNTNGQLTLSLSRIVSGAETTLRSVAPAGLNVVAGEAVRIRLRTAGSSPTTLSGKVWKVGAAEPSAWQVSISDATAGLQAAGTVGVQPYLSSTSTNAPQVVSIDNFTATTPGGGPPPTNQPPNAVMSVSCNALNCSANAAGSTDPDGSITGYSWNWGDGTPPTTGATSSHTYTSAGTRMVTLTVTDNGGQTGTATSWTTVTAPPPNTDPFVADSFARVVSNGLGSADVGGAWTVVGSAANYSVSGGVAALLLAKGGSTASAYVGGVLKTDTDLRFGVTTDKAASGNGTYVTAVGRRVSANLEYDANLRLRPDGSVVLALSALKGTSTVVYLQPLTVIAGINHTPGVALRVRVQVTGTGPTTVRAKVWSGATEPAAWQLSATDSTASLQAPGAVGVTGYVSSGSTNTPIVLRVSDLSARPVTPA